MAKTLVPWLWQSDLEAGTAAVWEIDYERHRDTASCWAIQTYGQRDVATDFMIVHATRGNGNDGGRITLALSGTARYDVYARECFAMAKR